MVIKTGCSASTIALHEACRAIQRGDASGAVVGGASMITTPALTATMSAGELLAPDGSCKTFDASADGYARAEAITAIYIKPLADALRDGNPVRAVIKGTSTNCDGKSVSLVTPNGVAQEALMRKAYRDAGLDPRETAFVEVSKPPINTYDANKRSVTVLVHPQAIPLKPRPWVRFSAKTESTLLRSSPIWDILKAPPVCLL